MKRTGMVLLALVLTLTGCETTKGFGRDLQRAGTNLESVAESATP